MDLSSRFNFPKVRFDQDNEVVLLTGLKAPKIDSENRQPLNLVTVLDISGSMSGDKIERMKKTVQILIGHLTEHDQLGIVVFSTNFTKLASVKPMTSDRKEELKTRVAGLQTRSTTNISGATLLGFELLQDVKGSINRALLFTDGLPNVGLCEYDQLIEMVNSRPKHVSLSCFGFGSDHDPELLQGMAKAGGGNFYFVEDVDSLNSSFAQELGGLVSCFAQNIKIEVTFKPGVSDVDVLNKAWEWEYDDDKLTIRLPDLYAEEEKNILTKLSLDKREKRLPREITIADIKVTYTDLIDKKEKTIKGKAKIEFVKEGEESTEEDKDIKIQLARLEAAEAQRKAVEMANAGDFSGAQKRLRRAGSILRSAGDMVFAEELVTLEKDFSQDSYSAMAANDALSNAYAYGRGRSVGKTKGAAVVFCSTAQDSMTTSFEADGKKRTQKPEPIKEDKEKKKKKKKKYNPMTD